MTPEQIAKARKIIDKPWYNRWRAWYMRQILRYAEKICPDEGILCKQRAIELIKIYFRREVWYRTKMQENEKARRRTDR